MADFSGLDPQEGMVGPPQNEEEVQQRMSGWQKFINAMQSDPTTLMGTLRFATQMMQPVAPGQSALGHGAAALEDSINYAATAKTQREAQARAQAESAGKVGLEGAQAAHAAAQASDITARTPGAVQLQDALTKLYGSHANYYDLMAKAANMKADTARQILHTTTIENADGSKTLVNTHGVNGKLYIDSYTPPRFTDEAMARLQAQKDVDKITPFWGKAPYQGTKEDEIRRRTAKYLTGQRVIAGPGGQVLSPEQFEQLDQAQVNTPGKQLSAGERGIQRGVVMTPEERAADEAHNQTPGNLEELKLTLANAKDPKIRALLQGELDRIMSTQKQGAPGPVKVVRNADGTLGIEGQAPPGKSTGGAPPPADTPQATAFDAAKAALSEAQARLATYGSIQRRKDPAGYKAAQTAVAEAKKAYDNASSVYQGSVGELPAARMPLRVK